MNDLRKKLVYPALAGAVYAALTMVLAPISYGGVQLRVSEVLCMLPFFLPETAVGLFLGCALANTISAAGLLDIVFGSLATLLAGLLTAAAGRRAGWRLRPQSSACWGFCRRWFATALSLGRCWPPPLRRMPSGRASPCSALRWRWANWW